MGDWTHFRTSHLVACVRLLSLRLSPRHTRQLPGSCFEKNARTLVKTRRALRFLVHFFVPEPFCALACCHHVISGLLTPLPGNFSTFARDTNTLSVWKTYLDLPVDTGVFTCQTRGTLLFMLHSSSLRIRGCHPLWQSVPSHFCSGQGYSAPHLPYFVRYSAWSLRLSVTLTGRIPVGLFSFPY